MTTGEALNKRYHELTRPDIYPTCKYSGCTHEDDPAMPALHLDVTLCIAEADKLGGYISISAVEDDPDCEVKGRHWNVMLQSGKFEIWPDVCAVSLCEAILAALVAKKEAERE